MVFLLFFFIFLIIDRENFESDQIYFVRAKSTSIIFVRRCYSAYLRFVVGAAEFLLNYESDKTTQSNNNNKLGIFCRRSVVSEHDRRRNDEHKIGKNKRSPDHVPTR